MSFSVVYRASPGDDLTEAARVLKAAGCHPVTPDNPNPTPDLDEFTGGTLLIRVAVPEDEETTARAVLEEWMLDRGGSPEHQSRTLKNQTVWFLLVVGGALLLILVALTW